MLRIASLEPEPPRCDADTHHASLMHQPAALRLVLSDDNDGYEGRYGIEEPHQAVLKAVLQRILPLCLQASACLPRIIRRDPLRAATPSRLAAYGVARLDEAADAGVAAISNRR